MAYNDYICAKSGRHFRDIGDWEICAKKRDCAKLPECPLNRTTAYPQHKDKPIVRSPLTKEELERLGQVVKRLDERRAQQQLREQKEQEKLAKKLLAKQQKKDARKLHKRRFWLF